ncbi:transposase [Chamaesiphon sp.]|uniref:helix-turn-helix domain-containing protein n=1 Tax=Chamaesiphon sp. TaxID=2814140 RepID=UPI003593F9AE
MNLSKRLRSVSLDKKQWQRLYYKNQQSYIRQRLSAIRYLSEGSSRAEVAQLLGCTDLTIAKWIGKYLETGLEGLVEPIKHQVKERLNPEQQQEIKGMVLNDRPTKYGIDREIWTGKIIVEVIKQRWGVDLKTSRIYEILDNLNLSHQKAHRDYDNADPEKQKKFVKILKKKCVRESVGRKFYSLMNSQYLTDQAHTMDGPKRILDLKCHQMKVKKERS